MSGSELVETAPTASSTQLVISSISKSYGPVQVLSDLSFSVAKGEIMAMVGPSGCGKTTLLKCLSGLEDISAGSISIAGEVVSTPRSTLPPHRRMVGLVFQSYALWPHLSVRRNVAYGMKVLKRPRAEITRRVNDILELVGLDGMQDRLPSELSGGQQQRVALARSLVVEPRVLLLDEPLSNLDAALRDHMRREIRRMLKATGITAVYVTHDQKEAMSIADRVVLLNRGRAVQSGTPGELYSQPSSVFAATFIGRSNVVKVRCDSGGADPGDSVRVTASFGTMLATRPDEDPGSAAVALLRPEDLVIGHPSGPSGPGDNRWPAVVLERTYEGSGFEYLVKCGTDELRLVNRSGQYEVGETVELSTPAAAVRLLAEADA